MKGGSVAGLPVECRCPLVQYRRPLSCSLGGYVEGRGWCVLCCPVFGLGLALCIVRSSRIVPVPLLSCVAVFVVGGEVRWGGVCAPLSSSVLCSLSQHCWFRVVSL